MRLKLFLPRYTRGPSLQKKSGSEQKKKMQYTRFVELWFLFLFYFLGFLFVVFLCCFSCVYKSSVTSAFEKNCSGYPCANQVVRTCISWRTFGPYCCLNTSVGLCGIGINMLSCRCALTGKMLASAHLSV